ncbi:MAG: sulfatase-like hydrolase/transferase, partial [Planctomycetes bacterium]|nr:sulfatase-like hydrolase/transferase [Planctomycetota bacterium]
MVKTERHALRSVDRVFIHLLLLAGVLCLAASCSKEKKTDLGAARCNLLLITLDTTRADRLGCYGYEKAQTPALDRLAGEGVRFEQAFSNVPLTLPSHATIFTGLYPMEHGLRVNGRAALGAATGTMAEQFRDQGYDTGAFVAAFVLDARFGLDQGFDRYDQDLGDSPKSPNPLARYRPGNRVADAVLEWLAQRSDKPFFCWVHFFDPHLPLQPPLPYRNSLADPYDGEVAFMDAQVQRLIDFLEEHGIRDETLVVAVGDHGEGLDEHQEKNHGFFLYDSTLHVPLLFSMPGTLPAGTVLNDLTSLVDLYPTILELFGWTLPKELHGRSFACAVRREKTKIEPLPCYGETLDPLADYGWSPLFSLTAGEWKYIQAPKEELYHRKKDPKELTNAASDRPEVVKKMKASLAELQSGMVLQETSKLSLSTEEKDRLRGLGYGGGRLPARDPAFQEGLRDPKEMIQTRIALYRGEELTEKGRLDEAEKILQQVVKESPETAAAHEALGLVLARQGKYREAITAYREAIALDPALAKAHMNLGCALSLTNAPGEAIEEIQKAIRLDPALAEAYKNLAVICEQSGRLDEAETYYMEAFKIDPDLIEARMNLGLLLAGRNRLDEAVLLFREITERAPRVLDAYLNLGVALRMQGRLDEAIKVFEQALTIHPG